MKFKLLEDADINSLNEHELNKNITKIKNLIKENKLLEHRGQTELKKVFCSIVSSIHGKKINPDICQIHHLNGNHNIMNYNNIVLLEPAPGISRQAAHAVFHRRKNPVTYKTAASNPSRYDFTMYFLSDYINGMRTNPRGPRRYIV